MDNFGGCQSMNKASYNPLFLHVLTKQPMEEIDESPSLANLPGRLASVITKNLELVDRAYPENKFYFKC